MEGDDDFQDLLRGLRGSGGTTYGVATHVMLKLWPEQSNVVAYEATVLGISGISAVQAVSSQMPSNVVYWFEQLGTIGFQRTLIIAACYGPTMPCRSTLQPFATIGNGRFRTYSSHYSFTSNMLDIGYGNNQADNSMYQASIAIPQNKIQNRNVLDIFESFHRLAPPGITATNCIFRPLGTNNVT